MKKLWHSKTFWIAILQALSGILVAILSELPELQMMGGVIIFKSALDIALRMVTSTKIDL